MQRPLLLEGEPGTGKTALAEALAEALGLPLVRLQCYEGIDATQALYDWDFPRQILHLRALEARGRRRAGAGPRRPRRASTTSGSCSPVRCSPRCSRARWCCSSTRSTGPTTSSRRSCWRCSRRTRSAFPELRHDPGRDPAARGAHLQPDPRAPRRAEAAVSLPLDRPPRAWSARSRSSAPARLRCPPPWRARSWAWCSSCASATTSRSHRGSRRPSTGRGRCSTSAPASSTSSRPRARSGRW